MTADEPIKACSNCKHYMQHYIKVRFELFPTACGHCEHKKNLQDELKLCQFWKLKPDRRIPAQTDAQIKKLLERIECMQWQLENLVLIVADLNK